jgi:hemoglobin/transferrin/lactoferrin receptor protein
MHPDRLISQDAPTTTSMIGLRPLRMHPLASKPPLGAVAARQPRQFKAGSGDLKMANGARSAHALLWGVSAVALSICGISAGAAQAQQPDTAQASGSAQNGKQTSATRSRKRQQAIARTQDPDVLNANAQAPTTSTQSLDTITVTASKTEERAIDALAPVSIVTLEQIQGVQPNRIGDLLRTIPGVSLQDRGDDPSTAVNIRGLQDFGRVAVVVDGARQNYQRSGHNANGSFFLDPELIGGIDIVRGPTANIYGSGAIGGVASFRTKDIEDVVRPGERWGVDVHGMGGSNKTRGLASVFGGIHLNPTSGLFGGAIYRSNSNHKDGSGTEIGNTNAEVAAGLLKLTTRPWDGHQFKLGGVFQEFDYSVGQFNRGPTTTAAPAAAIAGSSVYDSTVRNYMGTLNWRYARPGDDLFDWNATFYGNRTENDQVKTYNNRITTGGGFCPIGTPGNNISGCIGDKRNYRLDTLGLDVNNTSRFAVGEWHNAMTYGFDAFRDDVATFDSRGNSNITTPGGERTVSGGFVQVKSNYSTWLEVMGAARYDRYELESATASTSGDRISPKVTLGITPVAGFTPYVGYAEGYRAPSITETLIAGSHATGGGPNLFTCPDGRGGLFCFLPNPLLRPEVGKTKEAGINLKYDGIFAQGDTFRGKFNVFRNDVDDFIDLVASPPQVSNLGPVFGRFSKFFQYQNTAGARIQGFEGEAVYDAGLWFVGVAGNLIEGENKITGVGLANLIQPRKVVTTAGVRLLEYRLTLSAQWISFAAHEDIPVGYLPATSGDLLNFYLAYNPTPDIALNFSVENALNKYYRPYAIPGGSTDGTTQNDVLFSSPGPGVTFKGGMRIHFGGA